MAATTNGISIVAAASAPSSAPQSPPLCYRKPVATDTATVSASSISFELSPAPLHPFDHPTLRVSCESARRTLDHAAQLLRDGQTVAFPTETVYGLGADATNSSAVEQIFAAKQRPADNPLIVHIASLAQLRKLLAKPSPFNACKLPLFNGDTGGSGGKDEDPIPVVYEPLIRKFWPGALTILLPLPSPSPLSPAVNATQPTFAARLPSHKIALALCELSGLPLAAPSANASGRPSPTTAAHVYQDLNGRVPLILDGESCAVGLESTVVDGLRYPPVVLRPGGISVEEIRSCGGVWEDTVVASGHADDDAHGPRAPGMKYKHYSPRATVYLYELGTKTPSGRDLVRAGVRGNGRIGVLRTRTWPEGFAEEAVRAIEEEERLAGGKEEGLEDGSVEVVERCLGVEGDEIGRALFAALRDMDEIGVATIHVEGIEEVDEGRAVMNRLRKAASVIIRYLT